MRTTKSVIRGVANIKTMAGRRAEKNSPHQLHLQLATLELERARRQQEHVAVTARARALEERFRQIDDEKAAILHKLDRVTGDSAAAPSREVSEAFCIRY